MAENRSVASEDTLELEEDFHYLLQLLPDGWQMDLAPSRAKWSCAIESATIGLYRRVVSRAQPAAASGRIAAGDGSQG